MAENVFADGFDTGQVNVGRSAVRSLNAANAHVEQSAVQRLTAQNVTATGSVIGVINGTNAEVRESAVGIVAGDYVRVEEGRVFVLLAPRVSGNVKAFLTLQSAFAFGAGYFVARRIAAAIFGRPNR